MSKLQGIGDSVKGKKLIVPASVEISGRCGAVIDRVKSALNGGGLSREEKAVTALTYLREVAVMGSFTFETTQVPEYTAQNKVKLTKELFIQIPYLTGLRDSAGLAERTALAGGVGISSLRGMNVFVPNEDGEMTLLQVFCYGNHVVVFHENVVHVFTIRGKVFKHTASYGASGGSSMNPANHNFILNALFGALWTAQNVGVITALPRCGKTQDNAGSCRGIKGTNGRVTNNWKRPHIRCEHWKYTRNGKRVKIPARVIGGDITSNRGLLDDKRVVRPKGSVPQELGGV